MSGGITFSQPLPAIGIVTRPGDNAPVLKIVGPVATGAVGDYFGADGVMTPTEGDAVNLTGTQRIRVATNSSGLYTWTYPIPYPNGVVPVIEAVAVGPDPQNGVTVNAQLEGEATNTSCKIRVTRTSASVVALIGLTILSINSPIATTVHITARAP